MQEPNSNERLSNSWLDKPLSSIEITKKIKQDEYGKKYFTGVYPRDLLPNNVKYPCSFVLNTDSSKGPGKHWLAIYYDHAGHATFFDSFGFPPVYYGLENYLDKTAIKWSHNSVKIQHLLTSTCGYYAVYFILLKSRDFDLKEILSYFHSDNFLLNDLKIINI